jgi:hypothetical protein
MEPKTIWHVSRNVYYYRTERLAEQAAMALPARFQTTYRVRRYTVGYGVQLHNSGDYLGPQCNPVTHACAWCPPVCKEELI